jgi:hypothetical protein
MTQNLTGVTLTVPTGTQIVSHYQQEFSRLLAVLEAARNATHLADEPTAEVALNELLLRSRCVS